MIFMEERRFYDFPKEVLRGIIRKAIQEGKLFDLIFSEEGRRLWARYPEEQIRRMVKEELKKMEVGDVNE